MIPKVMIIGYGQMGKFHHKVLNSLNVQVTSIIENDLSLLNNISSSIGSSNLLEELTLKKPNIILIATNTKTHLETLVKIKEIYSKKDFPYIFIEKPLIDNEYEQFKKFYKNFKEFSKKISIGYLLRFTPLFDGTLEVFSKNKDYKIKKINVIWQKVRPPKRPSSGVHIDETTHAIDFLLSYILPKVSGKVEEVELLSVDSILSDAAIDKESQEKIYGKDKREILSEINYKLRIKNLDLIIEGFSSFLTGPQRREIIFELEDHVQKYNLHLIFDNEDKDKILLENEEGQQLYYNEYNLLELAYNRIRNEWIEFLSFINTKKLGKLPSLEDAMFDILVTEALEMKIESPVTIYNSNREGFFKVKGVLKQLFNKRK